MDYRNALEKSILYIEEHLGENITVNDVAGAAGYSYYHLTRQFSAVLGESVGTYIKKRRLADAAKKLIYTDKRIIDIAMENGFDSSEAFSRAFKSAYKISPYTYRKNRLDLLISYKDMLNPTLLGHRIHNVTVHPAIVETAAIKTAGIRGHTTLSDNKLPQLWQAFHKVLHQIPNQRPGMRGFGICEACNQGNSLFTMNKEIMFSEVVAVEVDSYEGLPPTFVPKTLPGGRYAVFTHKGRLTNLMDTYNYIWGTWFMNTKEQLDWREDFELYDARFLGYDNPASEFDIYIPII